jgi:uncharacterized membrane protein YkvA (DUF1232 family)
MSNKTGKEKQTSGCSAWPAPSLRLPVDPAPPKLITTTMSQLWERLRNKARALKLEVYALLLACRDPRVPWYAKAFAALVAAYALSPIDLIPDFIPILGQLDDLVLVPLGVWLVTRLIPRAVLEDCRARARETFDRGAIQPWVSVLLVAGIWLVVLALVFLLVVLPILRRRVPPGLASALGVSSPR